MIEETKRTIESKELALKLYDIWVRERQSRPEVECTDKRGRVVDWKKDHKELRIKNFVNQLVRPRQKHLTQLRKVGKAMTTADKAALLVMVELPVLEVSTLLHKLSAKLAADPDATYCAFAQG